MPAVKSFHSLIKPIGLCLFIPIENALIIADLHLGFKAWLSEKGKLFYFGKLFLENKTIALGDPREECIVVPSSPKQTTLKRK